MSFIIKFFLKSALGAFVRKYLYIIIALLAVVLLGAFSYLGYSYKATMAENDALQLTVSAQKQVIDDMAKVSLENKKEMELREAEHKKDLAKTEEYYVSQKRKKEQYYAMREDVAKKARSVDNEKCPVNPAFIYVADRLREKYPVQDNS